MINSINIVGSGMVNEDILAYKGNRYWVLDGSTPITDKRFFSLESDAMFLVNEFSSELLSLQNSNELTNEEFIKKAMSNLRSRIKIIPEFLENPILQPSFAMAMINLKVESIEISLLSDCYVLMDYSSNVETLTDKRIEKIGEKTKKVRDYVTNNNINHEEGKEMIRRQIAENRGHMNKADGFWVGTLDGIAFDNTIKYTLSKKNLQNILICSDGFYRLFQYNLITPKCFFKRYSGQKLDETVELIRSYENTMPENSEYKKSDDASALLIKL